MTAPAKASVVRRKVRARVIPAGILSELWSVALCNKAGQGMRRWVETPTRDLDPVFGARAAFWLLNSLSLAVLPLSRWTFGPGSSVQKLGEG